MARDISLAVAICAISILLSGVTAPIQLGAQSAAEAAASTGPTYSRDVAPILYRSCTGCHRPGEIGPMSLQSYKDARPWAKAIGTRVAAGTMPPWHADPAIGEFSNDRRLTATEKETIGSGNRIPIRRRTYGGATRRGKR